MTTNVLRLVHCKETEQPKPDPAIVALCESVLEDARAGKITAIALTGHTNDNQIFSGWVHGDNVFLMLGALENLKLEFHRQEFEHYNG